MKEKIYPPLENIPEATKLPVNSTPLSMRETASRLGHTLVLCGTSSWRILAGDRVLAEGLETVQVWRWWRERNYIL